MTVVDDVPAGLQRESADSGTVERGHEAAIRHVRHLEIDTFWQTQPMQCCKSVCDVIVTTQSIHQTSRSVENRRQMSLLICRKPDQQKIAIVEPRMHKRHNQRTETVVSNESTQMSQLAKRRETT